MAIEQLAVVGKSYARRDSTLKVCGAWEYGSDLHLPGMLYGLALRSPVAHARILSINTERARELDGVVAVITHSDFSVRFGSAVMDEPVLADGVVRYAGEPIVAVAARTEQIAREAIDLVELELQELPGVYDPLKAMETDAPLVHSEISSYELEPAFTMIPGTNIINHTKIRKGNVETGFEQSEHVFVDEFETQYIQHCPLETHSCAAQVSKDGRITVWSSTQSPYNVVRDLSRALHVTHNKIRVIATGVGGGFGSKIYLRSEPLAVALAKFTAGRPVRIVFSREEEFTSSVSKHPCKLVFKTGVKSDGTLVAREIKAVFNTGGYADTGPLVARNGAFSGTGPYRIPNIKVDSYCVYTNNPQGGAFRGYGVPQLTWAHESQMDMIANRLGLDPVDLRMKNLFDLGDETCTGEVLRTSVGVKETLRKATERAQQVPLGEPSGPRKVRGRGVATMHKLTYTPTTSCAVVKLHQDGSVNILSSTLELGQGIDIALRQILAEKMGMEPERITVSNPDTDYTPYDQSTSGSRSTFHMGNAIIRAADHLISQLADILSAKLDVDGRELSFANGLFRRRGTNETYRPSDIVKLRFGDRGATIQGTGIYTPLGAMTPDKQTGQSPRVSAFWMYATQIADVEVDLDTGEANVLRIFAAHDAGRLINPAGAIAQIEGGVVQGLGATLHEEMIVREGVVSNPSFTEYKIPCSLDIPEIIPIFVESAPHDEGPYGAKGLGEPVLAPTSPAIANAIFRACGARVTSLPITPEKILTAMEVARNQKGHTNGQI